MTQANTIQSLTVEENQLAKQAVNIHKFGGSSLASVQCIERVVDIICRNCLLNDLVVVSANGDTTDALINLYQKAVNQEAIQSELDDIFEQQQNLINALLSQQHAKQLLNALNTDIEQLVSWLSINPEKHQSDILAYGELWSARLLSAVLNERICPSYYIDSRDFLTIESGIKLDVDYATSAAKYRTLQQANKLAVITGYVAKDKLSNTCTLGRNGSDYSATIFAALTKAHSVTLWTDVDGIYSADPREVPLARKLHRLPSGVAKELGRLGNPVLHAKTLKPFAEHHAQLHVASSFDADKSGTEIGKFGQIAKQELSVTYLNDLLLAKSESLLSEAGKSISEEFSALYCDSKQGVILINQSQQKALSQRLASYDTEITFTPVAILATVGHKVAKHGDIRAKFKRALKQVQPLSIVASESTHSLIAVLNENCTTELLNNVHHDMTKDAKHIGLVVAGLGNIGERFLQMLPRQLAQVSVLENVHLVGLIGSKKALIDNDGIDVNIYHNLFDKLAKEYDDESLLSWLANHPYDELVLVDITPSKAFSDKYAAFFEHGIHVIGANKWAASSDLPEYQNLLTTAVKHDSLWLGNTTVGAGLPINHAITDLINSGDEINEISGIFSGTLSWLFEKFDNQQPFSELLKVALAEGITEPDPREDLSGSDVQRKLLILARLAGFELSMADIDVENLVPEDLRSLSVEAFLSKANLLDTGFSDKYQTANSQSLVLRYIARFKAVDNKIVAKVSLETLPQDHAFAHLTPCDNIFQITSQWYRDNPLIIRGPGAGRDVTAGGLHSDLVTICQQLVSKTHQTKIKGINE